MRIVRALTEEEQAVFTQEVREAQGIAYVPLFVAQDQETGIIGYGRTSQEADRDIWGG